jgi:hypothetical protein
VIYTTDEIVKGPCPNSLLLRSGAACVRGSLVGRDAGETGRDGPGVDGAS